MASTPSDSPARGPVPIPRPRTADSARYPASVRASFWSRVDTGGGDGCWLWRGGQNGSGYGLLKLLGVGAVAHRVAWLLHHGGEIPTGSDVTRTCGVRLCVRPEHLRLRHGRRGIPSPSKGQRGADHHRARLTAKDVRLIRKLRAAGLTYPAISKRVGGVDPAHLRRIALGLRWKNVT